LADRGLRTGRIGVEEATMFTFYELLVITEDGPAQLPGFPISLEKPLG
jgi:hypothetical protein